MFPALQLEILERFTDLEKYYRASRRLRGDSLLTVKGLLFVQIYAIHEYAVRSTLEIAIAEISSHGHRYATLRPSLLALFLESEIQSFRDSPARDRWAKRVELFERAVSNRVVQVVAYPFPTDESHFRATHLKLILRVLGIGKSLTVRRRHVHYIDEVVNHRNAIAHGGETAASIGRRFSRNDMWKRIRTMQKLTLRFLTIISEHCTDPVRHRRR